MELVEMSGIHPKTIIIICGPTAVGKTRFAVKLATELGTEIISADSRQCYKELNIGVAKPSADELSVVHHYFINSHSIHQEVNAVVFEQYALQSVQQIFLRHATAVMVGGTGLYIKAFSEGMDDIPPTNDSVRQQIINDYEKKGIEYLQQQLQEKDQAFWKVAEQQNPQRLMRALEVFLSTGRSVTSFRKGNKAQRPFNIIRIGLDLPRSELYGNINERVNSMMEAGLLDEVATLYPYRSLNALQSVGYRELFDHLNEKLSLGEAIEKIKTNTRQYAKRQLTWFKKDEQVKWYPADEVSVEDALALIKFHL